MLGENTGKYFLSGSRLVILTPADPDLRIMKSFFFELESFAKNTDMEIVWRIIDGLRAFPSSFPGFDFSAKSICVEWNSPAAPLSHSEAIAYGFFLSQGDFVMMMSPDMSVNIKDIPRFVSKINDGTSVVAGWRKKRKGVSAIRRALTGVFNGFLRIFLGLSVHDVNTSMALVSPAAISFFLVASANCPSPALHTAYMLKREIREVSITVEEAPGKKSVYSAWMRFQVGVARLKEFVLYIIWSCFSKNA